jgi:hypothetical protein
MTMRKIILFAFLALSLGGCVNRPAEMPREEPSLTAQGLVEVYGEDFTQWPQGAIVEYLKAVEAGR